MTWYDNFVGVLCVVLRYFRKIWIHIISFHMLIWIHICRIRTAYLWQIMWFVLRDVFLASIFLAYVEPKLFFSLSRGKMCDGRWSEVRTQFVKFGVLEIVWYIRRKTKQRTAPWEKSTKSTSVRKKIPLSSQVHTTDIPQDLRSHMDKSAFFS